MSALGAFDKSTLGAFTRSTLGARGPSTPASKLIGVSQWSNTPNNSPLLYSWYRKIQQGLGGPLVSEVVFFSGAQNGTGYANFQLGGSSQYFKQRHIRGGTDQQETPRAENNLISIANPSAALTPSLIEYTFPVGSPTNRNFVNEKIHIFGVQPNSNPGDVTNYRTLNPAKLLASVLVTSLTNGALNTISFNVATYLSIITDATWALLFACDSDYTDTDPGLTVGGTNGLTGGTLGNSSPAEYLKFTY